MSALGAEHTQTVLQVVRAELLAAGFDLCANFVVAQRLPGVDFPFDRLGLDAPLGIVVGNTKRLWPRFARQQQQARSPGPQPLDDFVESQLSAVVEGTLARAGLAPRHAAYFSHRTDYPLDAAGARCGPVPIQRVAELAGLASMSPAHLSVHPRVGPWLALRAILILPCEGQSVSEARSAPCARCATRPCEAALVEALAPADDGEPPSLRWIAVRDACPVGRTWRYDPPQLRFHYRGLDRASTDPEAV